MAIHALHGATTHFLSSSQVLTSPAALVKELLDNALDAKATSIDIIISANTLDKIEVRDNGHGIAPEDLHVLGRRGYTSKLRNFEELKTIGGLSLGFRGEALASAAELGQVSIITRTEGETVATAVKLKAHEGVESRNPACHPVGTTVCIINFLSKLPVRKINALKDAKKSLSRIKDLLQSYALARLNIRFSLKILKAEKGNWSFTPRPKGAVRDILSQVISRDVTAQCIEKISDVLLSAQIRAPGEEHISLSYQPQHAAFTFQAFLPNPQADFSKITGGQYVSVDSRPVSCARGTMKKVVTLYKSFISVIAASADLGNVKEPFLRLNIMCPVASYDPNIEPAKDSVLFEDELLLLSLAEEWFESIYGAQIRSAGRSRKDRNDSSKAQDVTQARRQTAPRLDMSEENTENIGFINRRKGGLNGQHLTPNVVRTRSDTPDGLDPWAITKSNTLLAKSRSKGIGPLNSEDLLCIKSPSTILSNLPITCNSTMSPISPESHHLPYVAGYAQEDAVATDSFQGSLDSWLDSCNAMHVHGEEICPPGMTRLPTHVSPEGTSGNKDRSIKVKGGAVSLPRSPKSTRERVLLEQPAKSRKPFVPPFITTTSAFLQVLPIPVDIPKEPPYRPLQHSKILSAVTRDIGKQQYLPEAHLNPHVEQALDFERRKKVATLKLRAELRQSQANSSISLRQTSGTIKSPPQDNSYQGAFAVAVKGMSQRPSPNDLVADKAPIETSLPDGDPRAYLMRRHHSRAAQVETMVAKPKLKRAKTLLLPLETTPTHMELHSLLRVIQVDLAHVREASLNFTGYDEYITLGKLFRGLKGATADLLDIENRAMDVDSSQG